MYYPNNTINTNLGEGWQDTVSFLILLIMAHLLMLYSEWLDQDLVASIQNKSPPIIFSLDFLGFGGNLSQLFFVNMSSIILRPDKYNKKTVNVKHAFSFNPFFPILTYGSTSYCECPIQCFPTFFTSYLILKNNPNFNYKIRVFWDYLMNV